MAAVLIYEPHDDISSLIGLVVKRLGHTPLAWHAGDAEPGRPAVAVIEPGEPAGMRLAIRMAAAGVPILFTSIFPPDDAALSLRPTEYLVKPFPLYRLEQALIDVLGPPAQTAAAAAC